MPGDGTADEDEGGGTDGGGFVDGAEIFSSMAEALALQSDPWPGKKPPRATDVTVSPASRARNPTSAGLRPSNEYRQKVIPPTPAAA